ncbi:hypothetical protein RchiOBHm_Chr2g0115221 [Rosa chinensis]|uniref:Uncharacterized protein n=1 Tax=Rosa chinensis TaxID=74649 RepID=A0A2P6RR22_ROSCH|nr:hypothetical protein RchiOBHm_Chr2g0115221 [Rosa chinensis]
MAGKCVNPRFYPLYLRDTLRDTFVQLRNPETFRLYSLPNTTDHLFFFDPNIRQGSQAMLDHLRSTRFRCRTAWIALIWA